MELEEDTVSGVEERGVVSAFAVVAVGDDDEEEEDVGFCPAFGCHTGLSLACQ